MRTRAAFDRCLGRDQLILRTSIDSITSHCSGNEPALLPRGGIKTGIERAAQIEPRTSKETVFYVLLLTQRVS